MNIDRKTNHWKLICTSFFLGFVLSALAAPAQAGESPRYIRDLSPGHINPKDWAVWKRNVTPEQWQDWRANLTYSDWQWWRQSLSPANFSKWHERMGRQDLLLWQESAVPPPSAEVHGQLQLRQQH